MKKKLFRIVCLCSLVSIVLCACGKNTNSEVNVTHISDGLESEYEWNSPEIDKSMPFPLVKHLLMPLTLPKFSDGWFPASAQNDSHPLPSAKHKPPAP